MSKNKKTSCFFLKTNQESKYKHSNVKIAQKKEVNRERRDSIMSMSKILLKDVD